MKKEREEGKRFWYKKKFFLFFKESANCGIYFLSSFRCI